MRAMWQSLFGPLAFLFISAFMISFAMTNFEGIYAFYAKERYGYGPETIGVILTDSSRFPASNDSGRKSQMTTIATRDRMAAK